MPTLLFGAASAAKYSAKHRSKFLAEMKSVDTSKQQHRRLKKDQTPTFTSFADELNGSSERSKKMRKRVMEKATFISPVEIKEREERLLQNNYNNAAANGNYNVNNQGNGAYYNDQKDGADDYFVASGKMIVVFELCHLLV